MLRTRTPSSDLPNEFPKAATTAASVTIAVGNIIHANIAALVGSCIQMLKAGLVRPKTIAPKNTDASVVSQRSIDRAKKRRHAPASCRSGSFVGSFFLHGARALATLIEHPSHYSCGVNRRQSKNLRIERKESRTYPIRFAHMFQGFADELFSVRHLLRHGA